MTLFRTGAIAMDGNTGFLVGWMAKRSVGARLGLLTLLAVILGTTLVATSVVGGLYIRDLAQTDQVTAQRALSSALLEKDFASLERDVFRHGMVRSGETREDMETNIAELDRAITDTAGTMEDPQDPLFANFLETKRTYVDTVRSVYSSDMDGPAAAATISESSGAVDVAVEQVRDREIARSHEIDALQNSLLVWVMGISVVITGIGCGLYYAFAQATRRTINGELGDLRRAIGQIEAGQLDITVPHAARSDEIGELARAAERLREANRARAVATRETDQMIQIVGDRLRAMSEGDLSEDMPDIGERFSALRADFNAMGAQLRDSLAAIAASAQVVRIGASEINSATDDLARRTETNAAEISEVSETIGSISQRLQGSSLRAGQAAKDVSAAVSEAQHGGEVVGKAVTAMAAIEVSTAEIGKIISVIDEIAFQTNLLALNAGVEAARAGDVGRGFAVVASEVRALAQRSADAAKDIRVLIHGNIGEVEQGAQLVRLTGEALTKIIDQITSVTEVVVDLSQGSQQQSAELEKASGFMANMERSTQQNAAMVEEGTAAARGLVDQADVLADVVGGFRIGAATARPARSASGHIPAQAVVPIRPTRAQQKAPAKAPATLGNLALSQPATDFDDWSEF